MFIPFWLIIVNALVLIAAGSFLVMLSPLPLTPLTRSAVYVAGACCLLIFLTAYLLVKQ
jgi:hypothetical protein